MNIKLLVIAVIFASANSGAQSVDSIVNAYAKENGVQTKPVRISDHKVTKYGTKYAEYNFSDSHDDLIRICFVEKGSHYTYCMMPEDFMELTGR